MTRKTYRDKRKKLAEERTRLVIALHDATRRPMGVVPESAVEFYDEKLGAEAEKRRPRTKDS